MVTRFTEIILDQDGSRVACLLLAALLVLGLTAAQGAQGRRGLAPKRAPAARRPARMVVKDQHHHGASFMKRLRDLAPEEQERVLANDERFQHLPPERQEMIRQRVRRWNALSPQEKERLREREEIFENFSPQQRQEAQALFQQWQQLEPERRRALMQSFRRLRDLPPSERQRFLSSPGIGQRFLPPERALLSGLAKLLPSPEHSSNEGPEH